MTNSRKRRGFTYESIWLTGQRFRPGSAVKFFLCWPGPPVWLAVGRLVAELHLFPWQQQGCRLWKAHTSGDLGSAQHTATSAALLVQG